MRYLSLYSGIGMHDLGFERAGWQCVGQVEISDYCRTVLAKHWPDVPRWSDVRSVRADDVVARCGAIDLITGGFACQDISVAGKGAGLTKFSRSGITFRNLFRLARGIRPAWLVIENVAALRTRGIDRVMRVMERLGYATATLVVGAGDLGAPHRRQRVWIVCNLADAEDCRRPSEGQRRGAQVARLGSDGSRWPARPGQQHEWERPRLLADAYAGPWHGLGNERHDGDQRRDGYAGTEAQLRRAVESAVGRATDGRVAELVRFANRNVLQALGNGNPPQVAELIARTINRVTAAMAKGAA